MNLDLLLFREIDKYVGELQEKIASEIVIGKATSFDDYRFRVGRIRGLQDALKIAKEVQERLLDREKRED
jgi:hypothetical protein